MSSPRRVNIDPFLSTPVVLPPSLPQYFSSSPPLPCQYLSSLSFCLSLSLSAFSPTPYQYLSFLSFCLTLSRPLFLSAFSLSPPLTSTSPLILSIHPSPSSLPFLPPIPQYYPIAFHTSLPIPSFPISSFLSPCFRLSLYLLRASHFFFCLTLSCTRSLSLFFSALFSLSPFGHLKPSFPPSPFSPYECLSPPLLL